VSGVGHDHRSAAIAGLFASDGQRGEVADAAPAHEAPAGTFGQARLAGEEREHLVLRADGTGRLQPGLAGEVRPTMASIHTLAAEGEHG
jgi:hypothetical protein